MPVITERSVHAEGVRMILNQMLSVMLRHGVKPLDSIGESFDPERHEAVARQGHEVYDEDLVCEQMQKGYMLHERLLRAAAVVVSAGKLDAPANHRLMGTCCLRLRLVPMSRIAK